MQSADRHARSPGLRKRTVSSQDVLSDMTKIVFMSQLPKNKPETSILNQVWYPGRNHKSALLAQIACRQLRFCVEVGVFAHIWYKRHHDVAIKATVFALMFLELV